MAKQGKGLDPTTVGYFYGRLSRHEAERILVEKSSSNGLYLLRLSLTKADDYAIAVCSENRVHHYSIERQPDGQVRIGVGKKFVGPIELIKHHKGVKDGLVQKLKIPCNRPEGMLPYVWPGVTISDLDNAIDRKHAALVQQGLARKGQKIKLLPIVAKEMHKQQPWFFGQLSRDAAERCLVQSRDLKDGKFLVRERSGGGSLALSMLHGGRPWHYKIHELSPAGKYNIDLGPEFDTIMDLITFYHNGGLVFRLTAPCDRTVSMTASNGNVSFSPVDGDRNRLQVSPIAMERGRPRENRSASDPDIITYFRHEGGRSAGRKTSSTSCSTTTTCSPMPHCKRVTYLDLQEEQPTFEDDDDYDDVYKATRRACAADGEVIEIQPDQLELEEQLGKGHFGSVRKASYMLLGKSFKVAVKTLKSEEQSESELMKEAYIMSKLDNPFIIRLIGVCRPHRDSFMMIVEMAASGSLREYLKRNHETPMYTIVDLLQQVARGMAYLENHKVVHRDLAARNILLYTERHAKISDFGLSRNLSRFKDYYESTKEEQWPIKWYPPEVLHDKKFASKSDVWSFGVTMWEATAYGETPYKGMLVNEYKEKLEQGYRLERPSSCPHCLYRIMILCWAQRKEDRPSFREILQQFELLPPI